MLYKSVLGTLNVIWFFGQASSSEVNNPGLLEVVKCERLGQEALAQDQVGLHLANNTFTISTPVEARARIYAQITSITIGTNSTDATAYLAPPDDAVRGVIHMAHSGEPHAEIINGLVPFNPELPIIDARSFGKKRSIIITFTTGPLPKAIRFWAGVHTCFPIYPKRRHATTAATSDAARMSVPHQPADVATIAVKRTRRPSPQPAHPSASSVGTGIILGTYNESTGTPARYHALPSQLPDTGQEPGSRRQFLESHRAVQAVRVPPPVTAATSPTRTSHRPTM
ncbi:hypothetical protein HPB49_007614 [Dermacentor silvarum]|uniref:Uncharacterized protein n=1 Tax=Dermacentor silvarum TaxID=543639 RepID=A0ACB8DB02_DERSI|nr:hypothetical protein HPB49_007614 [Dermacentor silvarum]